MKNFFKYTIRALALTAWMVPITTHAFVINSSTLARDTNTPGATFTVNYLLAAGGSDGNNNVNSFTQDIKGSVVFEFLGFGTNSVKLGVTATNTSLNQGNEIGLWQIAFGTDPDATGVIFKKVDTIGANKFENAVYEQTTNPPDINPAMTLGGTLTLNVASNTNPGANNLREGMWDYFELEVLFASNPNNETGVSFTPFSSFWQSKCPDNQVNNDECLVATSFQFAGTEQNGNGGPPFGVPEPHTILLMGIGLLGFGATRLRGKANA